MDDVIVHRNFEIGPTHINVFGKSARWTDDNGWQHDFLTQSQYERLGYVDMRSLIDSSLEQDFENGYGKLVEMLLVSPDTVITMYIQGDLTTADFGQATGTSTCWFDLPEVKFERKSLRIRVVAAAHGQYLFSTATRTGVRL